MTQAHPRTIAAATGLVGCLLLAACGSSSPTSANTPAARTTDSTTSASPSDATGTTGTTVSTSSATDHAASTSACSLITRQEAGAALSTDPGPGQGATSHGASSCMYGTSPSIVTVNLIPSRGKADYEHLRAQATAGQLVDVAGIGDAAFATFNGPAASIDFCKGDTFVAVVIIVGRTSAPPNDQAITLAKTAASRI
jgi:hypothetical protein